MTRKDIQTIIIAAGHNEKQVRSQPQMYGCYNCNAVFHNSEFEPDNHFCAPGCEPYVVCHYCGMDSIVCEKDLAGLALLNEETLKEIASVAFELI